jgi:hypothetical protein
MFREGGSVVRRGELSDEDRRDGLSLLALTVDYSQKLGEKHSKAKGASKASYAASPDLFVAISEALRQHSG